MGLFKASEEELRARQQKLDKKLRDNVLYSGGSRSVIKALLDKGANPNANPLLNQILSHYENSRHSDIARMLIAAGADVNHEHPGYGSPLYCAVNRSNMNMILHLISKNANVQTTYQGQTLAMCAAINQEWDILHFLYNHDLPEKADAEKNSLLLLQMMQRSAPLNVIEHVRAAGGWQPDVMLGSYSALHCAVMSGQEAVVGFALTHAAEVLNRRDDGGRTPLLLAVVKGNEAMAQKLIDGGAKVDIADNDGKTALVYAASQGSIKLVKAIMRAQEAEGGLPRPALGQALVAAGQRGHMRIVELMVEAGADVNEAAENGDTLLINAVSRGDIESCKMLLRFGADIRCPDKQGLTALDHAAKNKRIEQQLQALVDEYARIKLSAARRDGNFLKLDDTAIEIHQGSLSTTFNFWTQQVISSDLERGTMHVQNFDAVQRQDAILEACAKLKEMGGNPPEPRFARIEKKDTLFRPQA